MAGDVDRFKQGFFDRGSILFAMDKATRSAMARSGAYIRKVARNSMKRKKGPSPIGEPPHVHVGTLKNLTYFAYDQKTRSLVVGPVGLGKSDVPKVLEFGGRRVKPRPYMKPAMNSGLPIFAKNVRMAPSNT